MRTSPTKSNENTTYSNDQTLSTPEKPLDLDALMVECVDYFIQSEYQLALPYTLNLLDAYQKNQDYEQILNTFFLLVMIYEQVGDFPASFEILPFVIEKLSRLPVSDATVKANLQSADCITCSVILTWQLPIFQKLWKTKSN